MSKNVTFILITLLTSCTVFKSSNELSNKHKLKILRQELSLTKAEYKSLKNDDTIISQAYKTLKDTVEVVKINRHLDSFFSKKYSRKRTFVAFVLERIHKGRPVVIKFEGEEDKSDKTPFTPEMEKKFRKYFLDYDKDLEKAGGQWIRDTSILNSRRRSEPDSVRLIKIKKLFKKEDSLRLEKLKLENPKKYYENLEFKRKRDSLIRLRQKDSLN